MYIVSITYKVELSEVDAFLPEHVEYLKQNYAAGNFHASGRKIPRTGGVIFSRLKNKKQLIDILHLDPFYTNDLADYEVIEFVPSMTSEEFEFLIDS